MEVQISLALLFQGADRKSISGVWQSIEDDRGGKEKRGGGAVRHPRLPCPEAAREGGGGLANGVFLFKEEVASASQLSGLLMEKERG